MLVSYLLYMNVITPQLRWKPIKLCVPCPSVPQMSECAWGRLLQRENLMEGKTDPVEIAPLCGKLRVDG